MLIGTGQKDIRTFMFDDPLVSHTLNETLHHGVVPVAFGLQVVIQKMEFQRVQMPLHLQFSNATLITVLTESLLF